MFVTVVSKMVTPFHKRGLCISILFYIFARLAPDKNFQHVKRFIKLRMLDLMVEIHSDEHTAPSLEDWKSEIGLPLNFLHLLVI